MADAEQIRLRMEAARMRDTTHEQINDETIIAAVEQNPGMTANEIAALISRPAKNTRSRLKGMVRHGVLKSHVVQRGTVRTSTYYPENAVIAPAKKYRPAPVRDKVIAFIKANPGCSTHDIADHMGCTTKAATDYVTSVRKVTNLRSERSPNKASHIPARHWLEDEE